MVKYKKFPKYYVYDCQQNPLLLFMFLLTAPSVQNSHILAAICITFLKNVLD